MLEKLTNMLFIVQKCLSIYDLIQESRGNVIWLKTNTQTNKNHLFQRKSERNYENKFVWDVGPNRKFLLII